MYYVLLLMCYVPGHTKIFKTHIYWVVQCFNMKYSKIVSTAVGKSTILTTDIGLLLSMAIYSHGHSQWQKFGGEGGLIYSKQQNCTNPANYVCTCEILLYGPSPLLYTFQQFKASVLVWYNSYTNGLCSASTWSI